MWGDLLSKGRQIRVFTEWNRARWSIGWGFLQRCFSALAQLEEALEAIYCVAILALQPSSDPQPFSAPAGGGNEQGVETSATCLRKAFDWLLQRQPLLHLRKQLSTM